MKFKDIVAISGHGGLFQIKANRNDGLIASELGGEKSKFYSTRQHIFTPLESVTVYTTEDLVELKTVFMNMKKLEEEGTTPPDLKNADLLKAYFKKALPEYDEEKVYVSDIKKIVKWYSLLQDNNLLNDEDSTEEVSEETTGKTDSGEE